MNIYERINEVQKELKGVEKRGRNTHQNYAYAGHEDLNEAIRPLFVKHGIVQTIASGPPSFHPGGVVAFELAIRWTCHDDPSSFIEGSVPAVQSSTAKSGFVQAQQIGQAISYAVKNFQFKALMLTDSNEPDADSQDQNLSDKRELAPPPDPKLKDRALACLAGFGDCQSLEAVNAYKASWAEPAKWDSVKGFPAFRDQFVAACQKARKRFAAVPIT